MRILLTCLLLAFPCVVHAETFQDWLKDYKIRALDAGATPAMVERALRSVTYDPDIVALDRKQPETQLTLQQYVARTVTGKRIATGQEMLADYRSILMRVERDYGVPKEILVALWGKETDYGGYTGKTQTIDALATLAFEGRRRRFFEQELLNAMALLDRLRWQPDQMRGSWAGAIGQCQFMPSNYLRYGRDGNGDGVIDLWNDMDDVFYSMANLLKSNGWQAGQAWGQKAHLTRQIDNSLIGRDKSPQSVSFWEQRGVRFTQPVSPQNAKAVRLYQPDGPGTAAYAIYPNFDVLMQWNRSGYFATAVGLLSSSLSGKSYK